MCETAVEKCVFVFSELLHYFMYRKNVPCHVEHLSFAVQNKHFGSLCFPNRTGRWYLKRSAHFEFYTIQQGLQFF
jgi:hypothetical protein